MYELSERSLGFCTKVDPRLMAVVKRAIEVTEQDFGFTEEQSRTVAEQEEKVAQKVSKTMHTHHLINDGKGSTAFEKTPSEVGTCGAVDAVGYDGTKFVWEWPRQYVIASAFLAASGSWHTGYLGRGVGEAADGNPGDGARRRWRRSRRPRGDLTAPTLNWGGTRGPAAHPFPGRTLVKAMTEPADTLATLVESVNAEPTVEDQILSYLEGAGSADRPGQLCAGDRPGAGD